jgi:hypothetical protein
MFYHEKNIYTFSIYNSRYHFFNKLCSEAPPFNEGYWLSRQRGEVVYSSSSCPYYVIQTNFGYTVAASLNSKPFVVMFYMAILIIME